MRLILALVVALAFGGSAFAQNQTGKVMPTKSKTTLSDCPNGKCPLQKGSTADCPNCPTAKSASCPQGCSSACTSCKSSSSFKSSTGPAKKFQPFGGIFRRK